MKLFKKIILIISSGLGAGYTPRIPGTAGTLLGLIACWFIFSSNILFNLGLTLILIVLSLIVSNKAESIYGTHDDQRIVIDEIAGIALTLALVPHLYLFYITGFVLFRYFDIKKPLFIKASQKMPGGWGITADDAIAGCFSSALLLILKAITSW